MSIRYVGAALIVACNLFVSDIAKAGDSGFECKLLDQNNEYEIKLLGNLSGSIKECNPIDGNKNPKKTTFLTTVSIVKSDVCFFDEIELINDKFKEEFRFGEILYQRMALKKGKCPNISSGLYTAVPLGLSKEKRVASFDAIARTFFEIQSGEMKVSELLSGVSFFEEIFSSPYRNFKSALNESVGAARNAGRIEGYSELNTDEQIYIIYFRLENIIWHLEGKVENERIKILGVSS